MATVSLDTEFAHLQDLLGTIPMVRGFIPITVCFQLDDTTSAVQVEQELDTAASNLGQAFPYLAGRVLIDDIKDGHSGVPRIVRYQDKVQLIMNDLTTNTAVATSEEMKKANYPTNMLEPTLLLPPVCFEPYPVDPSLFAPVLVVQANLIRSGLLLTFVGNHHIMDATGLGYVIELFAKALRGEGFSENDISTGNQSRGTVIPILGEDYIPGPELDDIIPFENADIQTPEVTASSSLKSAWFRLTASDLQRLKSNASQQNVAPYVSTDDAVSALFWQAVSRARQARLGNKAKTYFTRPISVRRFFGLGKYIGHMVDTIYTEAEDVQKLPLGEAAGRLRRDLSQDDKIRYHVQALATMCSRLSDRSNLVYGANHDLDRDVLLTSWTNMGTGEHSYGDLLGVPDASRCPWMQNAAPMIIAFPKDKDGGMTLSLCLAEDELDKMAKDEKLLAYGQFFG